MKEQRLLPEQWIADFKKELEKVKAQKEFTIEEKVSYAFILELEKQSDLISK